MPEPDALTNGGGRRTVSRKAINFSLHRTMAQLIASPWFDHGLKDYQEQQQLDRTRHPVRRGFKEQQSCSQAYQTDKDTGSGKVWGVTVGDQCDG